MKKRPLAMMASRASSVSTASSGSSAAPKNTAKCVVKYVVELENSLKNLRDLKVSSNSAFTILMPDDDLDGTEYARCHSSRSLSPVFSESSASFW